MLVVKFSLGHIF